jgi:hypothetical protein
MRSTYQLFRNGTATRCPICDRRFGLVRQYSWRTTLCPKKCVVRFKLRQEADREWLSLLRAA